MEVGITKGILWHMCKAYDSLYFLKSCYCREKGIAGKDVTPYILARVNELTEGRSLAASFLFVKIELCIPGTCHEA